MFAKLFETTIGQILVNIDTGENYEPEVQAYFQPPRVGVCSVAWGFDESDAGWDEAYAFFEKFDEAYAVDTLMPAYRKAAELAPEDEA